MAQNSLLKHVCFWILALACAVCVVDIYHLKGDSPRLLSLTHLTYLLSNNRSIKQINCATYTLFSGSHWKEEVSPPSPAPPSPPSPPGLLPPSLLLLLLFSAAGASALALASAAGSGCGWGYASLFSATTGYSPAGWG